MALRRQRGSAQGESRPARRPVSAPKPLGSVRRGQTITTYGVGAMLAVGDESFIVSGLDSWNMRGPFDIDEPRLAARLGVAGFRLPPVGERARSDEPAVRVRRFPTWYSCSRCHLLQPFARFGATRGATEHPGCGGALVPSRFVVACEYGHLDEFPHFAWVHKQTAPSDATKHVLHLRSTGRTASLRGIEIHCGCGKSASLEGAFQRSAMERLKISCRGTRPWLGRDADEECRLHPRTLQRGSSAAWFPVVRSAISIPEELGSELQRIVEPNLPMLRPMLDLGEGGFLGLVQNMPHLMDDGRYTAKDILRTVRDLIEDADDSGPESASHLRLQEYHKLLEHTPEHSRAQDFVCVPPPERTGDPPIPEIDRIMLVKRLREVRALCTFTRVAMPTDADPVPRRASLSREDVSWRPAVEVNGEGVFLRLDGVRLLEWERQSAVLSRAARIRTAHETVLVQRARLLAPLSGGGASGPVALAPPESWVDARYVLIHTFAHALINEWSLDCGYPAAALRERLYASDRMAGVLIYTATSDSAGSLGGVVAQGAPALLAASVESALDRMSWCSADPLCMETEAGGTDSLNLAACHACVLLPETSCETNNTFLDRAMLIGHPGEELEGFFRRPGENRRT